MDHKGQSRLTFSRGRDTHGLLSVTESQPQKDYHDSRNGNIGSRASNTETQKVSKDKTGHAPRYVNLDSRITAHTTRDLVTGH